MDKAFPSGSVGRVMDPTVVALRIDWTVHQAVEALRSAPPESLYYLYVTDADNRLVGVLSMRNLLLAPPEENLEAIMSREIVSIRGESRQEEAVILASQKKFVAFPVVDAQDRLVGAIRPSDLIALAEAEMGGEMQRMFGAGRDERALSPVWFSMWKRLPWLQVNLGTSFLASMVVGLFASAINHVTALAVLMPIVVGQGANTGAQAMAVVIRGLGLGEVGPAHAWRVILKEMSLGLLNGLAVAIVCAAAVLFWFDRWVLAVVIGAAMVVTMIASGVAGAGIPLMMKALGRDPAQSSSIVMTTVADVVGFLAFLGLAAAVLPHL